MNTKSRLTPPPMRSPRIDSPEADAFISGRSQASQPEVPDTSETARSSALRSALPGKLIPGAEDFLSANLKGTKGLLVRTPESEYMMLRYLSRSVYDTSLQALALTVLRNFIADAMAQKGFEVERGLDGEVLVSKRP